jgi:hypothetical protein
MSNANWLIWGASTFALALILMSDLVRQRGPQTIHAHDTAATLFASFFIAMIAISILITFLKYTSESKGPEQSTNWTKIALMYTAMLAGISAQYVFFLDADSAIRPRALIKPILASPIVFIPLVSAYQSAPTAAAFSAADLMLILVAFQNGFFWKMIFDKQSKTKVKRQ